MMKMDYIKNIRNLREDSDYTQEYVAHYQIGEAVAGNLQAVFDCGAEGPRRVAFFLPVPIAPVG